MSRVFCTRLQHSPEVSLLIVVNTEMKHDGTGTTIAVVIRRFPFRSCPCKKVPDAPRKCPNCEHMGRLPLRPSCRMTRVNQLQRWRTARGYAGLKYLSAAHSLRIALELPEEHLGLLIDRVIAAADAVKSSCGWTIQSPRTAHDRDPPPFMLAGRPEIDGDFAVVECAFTERSGGGLELESACVKLNRAAKYGRLGPVR